jgi:hypothetical protein
MGDRKTAQDLRWKTFEATLDIGMLRDHIARLPDFAEFDVLDKAFAHAIGFEQKYRALVFFLNWPRLDLASRLVVDRAVPFHGSTQTHAPVVMKKTMAGVVGNTEQKVFDAGKRGGLSRLVQAVHKMKVGLVCGQIKACIGEVSICEKIETTNPHELCSLGCKPRRQIPGSFTDKLWMVAGLSSFENPVLHICSNFVGQLADKLANFRLQLRTQAGIIRGLAYDSMKTLQRVLTEAEC